MDYILGSDHSHYDWMTGGGTYVPIDYQRAYDNGSRFTFLKVGNGAVIQEHSIDELRRAIASPLLVGAYMWVYPVSYAAANVQANVWYSALKEFPTIPMAIDFETTYPTNPTASDLKAVIVEYQKLDPNRTILIYTGNYWNTYGSNDPFFAQFPVWWARYNTVPPVIPPPWNEWTFWQFSASGDPSFYGVGNGKLAVDENRYEGTIEELQALFGGTLPPPQGETMNKVTVIAPTLNVRSGPATSAAVLRQLKSGNIVYTPFAVETKPVSGQVWIRISESPVEYVAVGATLSSVEAVPGGQGLPVITFNLSADGYPAQVVTWTPS